jgi:hypothetical protein
MIVVFRLETGKFGVTLLMSTTSTCYKYKPARQYKNTQPLAAADHRLPIRIRIRIHPLEVLAAVLVLVLISLGLLVTSDTRH